MSDPMNDLNQATGAVTDLTDAVAALMDTIRTDFAENQAGFQALATNLQAVATNTLHFVATVDPDDPAPTRVAGGTFLTVEEVFAAAPVGGFLWVKFVAGKSHDLTEFLQSDARDIQFSRIGVGSNPILAVRNLDTIEDGNAHVAPAAVIMDKGGSLRLDDLGIQFDPLLAGQVWSEEKNALVLGPNAGNLNIAVAGCTITAADGQALADLFAGCTAQISLFASTFDGAFAVRNEARGLANVAKLSVTFINGGAISATTTNVTQN